MPRYVALIACRDLRNDDGSSADISIVRADSGEEEELGKTAELMGETPVFNKIFEFDSENKDDLFKVVVLDENNQSRGVATFWMSTVLGHKKNLGFLEMSADRGAVVVHIVEKIQKGSVKLKLKARDVKNVEDRIAGLRKPDPFYIISKLAGEGEWEKVVTSKTHHNTLDPDWEEVEASLPDLCNFDFDLGLRLHVYDEESFNLNPVTIGWMDTTLNILMQAVGKDAGLPIREGIGKSGDVVVESVEMVNYVNSKTEATEFMKIVAVALQSRSIANDKAKEAEALKEEAAAAKKAAEAAQKEADEKAAAASAAEDELASAVAAADAAEAKIGGLTS